MSRPALAACIRRRPGPRAVGDGLAVRLPGPLGRAVHERDGVRLVAEVRPVDGVRRHRHLARRTHRAVAPAEEAASRFRCGDERQLGVVVQLELTRGRDRAHPRIRGADRDDPRVDLPLRIQTGDVDARDRVAVLYLRATRGLREPAPEREVFARRRRERPGAVHLDFDGRGVRRAAVRIEGDGIDFPPPGGVEAERTVRHRAERNARHLVGGRELGRTAGRARPAEEIVPLPLPEAVRERHGIGGRVGRRRIVLAGRRAVVLHVDEVVVQRGEAGYEQQVLVPVRERHARARKRHHGAREVRGGIDVREPRGREPRDGLLRLDVQHPSVEVLPLGPPHERVDVRHARTALDEPRRLHDLVGGVRQQAEDAVGVAVLLEDPVLLRAGVEKGRLVVGQRRGRERREREQKQPFQRLGHTPPLCGLRDS